MAAPTPTGAPAAGDAQVEHFGPGKSASTLQTGYLVLTHGEGWTSRLIRFGQRLRFRGGRRKYARWNHVALVLDAEGNLAEALSDGVDKTNISKYEGSDYRLVRVECAQVDREQIAAFADAVLDAPHRTKYGWLTIASLFFTLTLGSTIMVGKIGTAICSGFASEALTRAGAIFPRPPAYMMPADIAEHFSVDGG
ncbi:MAG: hypothetical protein ACM3N0_03335 [Chloroflexota bacterium]